MTLIGLDHWWECWREHHECAVAEIERSQGAERFWRSLHAYERRRAGDAVRVLSDRERYIVQLERGEMLRVRR